MEDGNGWFVIHVVLGGGGFRVPLSAIAAFPNNRKIFMYPVLILPIT